MCACIQSNIVGPANPVPPALWRQRVGLATTGTFQGVSHTWTGAMRKTSPRSFSQPVTEVQPGEGREPPAEENKKGDGKQERAACGRTHRRPSMGGQPVPPEVVEGVRHIQ